MLTAKLKTFLLVKTKCILFISVGVLCNGSISDFDSESVGSIPTTPTNFRLIRCDYVVMVATQIVILLVWVRSPLVTPNKFAALADVVIAVA